MKGSLIYITAFLFLVGIAAQAQAVPSLGVGTGGYVGNASCTSGMDYWECFGGPYVSGGDNEGFQINSNPETLTAFTNIMGSNIYLLAEESWSETLTGTFSQGGSSTTLEFMPQATFGAFGSYDSPYTSINLGIVDSDWYALPSPPFNPRDFSAIDVVLAYSGALPEGDYIFAVADDNGEAGLWGRGWHGTPPDSFSPKTTSAVAVPEPSTLSMLLSGGLLFGIAVLRRRY